MNKIMNKKAVTAVVLEILAALFFIFYLSPLLLVLFNSGKEYVDIAKDPFSVPKNWGVLLENIKEVLTNKQVRYFSSFKTSLILTVVSVALTIILGSMCAWALVRHKTKFSNFVYFLFIAQIIVPFQVLMYPLVSWFRFLGENVTQPLFGFTMLRSYPGMVFAYLGFNMSVAVFLFSGYIKGIPAEIEEAAEIDGASKPQVFFRVVFPMMQPIIVTEAILQGLGIWNDYMMPMLLLGKDNAIQTIPLAVQSFVGRYSIQWGLVLTSNLLAMAPVLIIFIIFQKYIIKGMTDGAVKF